MNYREHMVKAEDYLQRAANLAESLEPAAYTLDANTLAAVAQVHVLAALARLADDVTDG